MIHPRNAVITDHVTPPRDNVSKPNLVQPRYRHAPTALRHAPQSRENTA